MDLDGAVRRRLASAGIDADPVASPICLGCHATASDVEAWQLDPTFHIEDGVQCERCHGPGSEYKPEAIMRDPPAARSARRAAWACGQFEPMPVQCGTWKNRLRAVTGA